MKIKGNKIGFCIFAVFTLFCMVLIFLFSYQSGEQSSGVSGSFYDFFIELTGFDFITHSVFRKLAHFSEFAALGFGFAGTVFCFMSKTDFLKSLIPCVIYAACDEIHQLFVPERAGRLFDVFIDSCGSAFGISIFLIIIYICNKIKK